LAGDVDGRRRIPGRPWLLAAVAVLVVVGALVAVRRRPSAPSLGSRLRLETTVAELSASLDGARVDEGPRGRVTVGSLRPDPGGTRNGAYRPALVTPAPSAVRFRLDLPQGAALRFGIGVHNDGKRHPDRAGLRFAIAVDGRELFAEVVNPARDRHQRRWFDREVDLGAWAGRSVEVALAVRATDDDAEPAGTPGWSHVRLVRDRWLDRQTASASAPSVLVLLVDALRPDAVGCYGGGEERTPAFDRLAASGLVFGEMVAQSSWTLPSVATYLTGLHPRSHGVNFSRRADDPRGLDFAGSFLSDRLVTLAERAGEAGITTFGASANPLVSAGANFAQGFERWHDLAEDKTARDWAPGREVNRAFLGWLRRAGGYRFLAYLHYMDVHDPYKPPPEFRPPPAPALSAEVQAGEVRDLAAAIKWGTRPPLPPAEIEHLRRLYEGDVRAWDAALAELLAGLEAAGRRDSTIVVVLADHGEEFQEHGGLTHGHTLYEELLRVPLVLAGPGVRRGRVETPVQGIDVLPTLAALLGLPRPAELPGQNLLGPLEVRPAIVETHRGTGPDRSLRQLLAVRTPPWKLIWQRPSERVELYDLGHDPRERQDLDASAPPARRDLLAHLAGWSPPAPPPVAGADPDLEAKLRALGYVQ
jgi:arylsulfatase A-like enzyme